ncbi:MAG: 4-hydroxybutyrate CoA-transferase, partial [Actinobacteria bacterium]|nr:4-hydroxybutyrate CoA-transferase [Actinomycetota bacterium]
MRTVSIEELKKILAGLPENPRIIASGNFSTPKTLLKVIDENVEKYIIHVLNAQVEIPNRPGVTHETAFVGVGMRHSKNLDYIPTRLSLLPIVIRDHYRPDVVLLHTSLPRFDTVSLGTEVNILPAAIETARMHGGIVIAQANKNMPYTYGDAQIYENDIDFLVEV